VWNIGISVLCLQDIAANLCRVSLFRLENRKVGDIVQIKEYMGKVIEINLRDTLVETFKEKRLLFRIRKCFKTL
jgi:small conductance mechanosensitive channel